MTIYTDGVDNVSVSTTETTINIPKDTISLQVTNRDTTNRVLISLGVSGLRSLIVPPSGAKTIDLTPMMQLYAMQGLKWDWGSNGFGGTLTHRTAAATATIDIEYTVLTVS